MGLLHLFDPETDVHVLQTHRFTLKSALMSLLQGMIPQARRNVSIRLMSNKSFRLSTRAIVYRYRWGYTPKE